MAENCDQKEDLLTNSPLLDVIERTVPRVIPLPYVPLSPSRRIPNAPSALIPLPYAPLCPSHKAQKLQAKKLSSSSSSSSSSSVVPASTPHEVSKKSKKKSQKCSEPQDANSKLSTCDNANDLDQMPHLQNGTLQTSSMMQQDTIKSKKSKKKSQKCSEPQDANSKLSTCHNANDLGKSLQFQNGALQTGSRIQQDEIKVQPGNHKKSDHNLLETYSNWNDVGSQLVRFFDSQSALLKIVNGKSSAMEETMNSIIEMELIQRHWTTAVLKNIVKMADELKQIHTSKLSESVAVHRAAIEILQAEIKQLKQDSTDCELAFKETQESELQERLDLQACRIAEKDTLIRELKEQLATRRHEYAGEQEMKNEDEEDDFAELTEEEVLQLEPQALINHIRRELGVGSSQLSPRQRHVFKTMRTKLGSALEKLARDIYSNDSQIILEVIQNADDNSYLEGVSPFLSVTIDSDKHLWITNNEMGFDNSNVIAISNVGGSTKKDSSRFTGHKGIGFKSVFKVTRTPYIISRNFCFRFNLDSELAEDNIGYILPEWVDRQELEELIVPLTIEPTMTHFYFPFTKQSGFPADELYKGFDMIPLFLRQLRHLELVLDKKKKTVVVNHELQRSHSLISLESVCLSVDEYAMSEDGATKESTQKLRYRIYRKKLDVPRDLQVSQGGRDPSKKTELILAFPVIEDPNVDPQSLEIQKVYSYLPIESAGFRFLIQGDFHLVSSRDRVHTQDLYNRWLSWMIPGAFREAFGLGDVDVVDKDKSLRTDLFFFLPSKEELTRSGNSESGTDGFWRRVMQGIREEIFQAPCVLTETGEWVTPDRVRVRPKDFEDLFTNDELNRALNLKWVSSKLRAKAVYGLGCRPLTAKEALIIINHENFVADNRTAEWFRNVYSFLGLELKGTQDVLSDIFDARIFPLLSGEISNLREGEIFTTNVSGHYDFGPKFLRLLDSNVIALLKADDSSQRFLDMVGIQQVTVVDIANSVLKFQHRLKRPSSPTSPEITNDVSPFQLWEQVRFVKDHWSDIGVLYPYLEVGMYVPVAPVDSDSESESQDLEGDGNRVTKPCSYHMSLITYFPDVEAVFDEIDPLLKTKVMFLDKSVLHGTMLKNDFKEWERFLIVQLKVNKHLRIHQTVFKNYEPSSELAFALDKALQDAKNDSPKTWSCLLVHLQPNWKDLRMSQSLIKQIKKSPSGFRQFAVGDLMPDLSAYKDLLMGSDDGSCIMFPTISGLVNEEMLTDLGIPSTMRVEGLKRLVHILKNPGILAKGPIEDLVVWNKVYAAMEAHNFVPKDIFIPKPDKEGEFVKTTEVRCRIPDILKPWTPLVEFPEDSYRSAIKIKKWFKETLQQFNLMQVLVSILNTEKPSKEAYKEVIFECYRLMNDLLAFSTGSIYLVLDRSYLLRSKKSAHFLVMPDDEELFQKFVGEHRGYCPILFVHPELAKLPNVVRSLKVLNIPSLSQLLTVCPVSSRWYGYYVIPPGETEVDLPVIRSAALTNLYRALLAEIRDISSKTLLEMERLHLGNLIRSTTVFVSCIDCDSVPVGYTIYGISRMVEEKYFIRTTPDGEYHVIVPATTVQMPLEDRVDLHALKELFPAMGNIDNYMKSCISRLLTGDLQLKLDSQYIITEDENRSLSFVIHVEDSEVVTNAQTYRKASSDPSRKSVRQHSYPILRNMPGVRSGPQIPGLTSFPRKTITVNSSTLTAPKMNSSCEFPELPHQNRNPMALSSIKNTATTIGDFLNLSPQLLGDSRAGSDSGTSANTGIRANTSSNLPTSTSSDSGTSTKTGIRANTSSNLPTSTSSDLPASTSSNLGTGASSSLGASAKSGIGTSASLDLPTSASSSLGTGSSTSTTMNVTTWAQDNVVNDHRDMTADRLVAEEVKKKSSARENDLKKIKDEIWSWKSSELDDVESRLLGKTSGLKHVPFIPERASGTVSAFLLSLWQLENESQFSKWIGRWAEKAAYNHLLHLCRTKQPLQGLSPRLNLPPKTLDFNNWISSNRNDFDDGSMTLRNSCDDTKGYDFCYEQTNGRIIYVEVKGHALESDTFRISSHEWEVARSVSDLEDAIYVILGINLNILTLSGPTICYLLEDPVTLESEGSIVRRPHTYFIKANVISQKSQALASIHQSSVATVAPGMCSTAHVSGNLFPTNGCKKSLVGKEILNPDASTSGTSPKTKASVRNGPACQRASAESHVVAPKKQKTKPRKPLIKNSQNH